MPVKAKAPLRYQLERRLLVALRRNIHHNVLGRVLTRARFDSTCCCGTEQPYSGAARFGSLKMSRSSNVRPAVSSMRQSADSIKPHAPGRCRSLKKAHLAAR